MFNKILIANRGEVALIVSQKGLAVGLMQASYFPAVILLIIVSAVVTPVALKILYTIHPEQHPAPAVEEHCQPEPSEALPGI